VGLFIHEFWWGLLWAVHPPWMTSFWGCCMAGDSNPGPPYNCQALCPLNHAPPLLDHSPPLLDHAPPLLNHAPPLLDHAPPRTWTMPHPAPGPCPTHKWTMPHPYWTMPHPYWTMPHPPWTIPHPYWTMPHPYWTMPHPWKNRASDLPVNYNVNLQKFAFVCMYVKL
jgi:hypothetical protein